MPWRRWWWKAGRWPGFGPFSHLPPWKRPGWLFGRGACWAYFWSQLSPRALLRYPRISSLPKSEEISALEEYKRELEDEKASIEEELREVEKRLEELKRGKSE
jgi:hypothetical protein